MQSSSLNLFGSDARLHHIGLVVKSLADVKLDGLTITYDPNQKVRVAFVQIGDVCVELIEPASADSPVSANLAKGVKLLHLCYEAKDISQALKLAEASGMKVIQEPIPAEAFARRKIAWVYHPLLGLFELLEKI
jgi:hypothetical protein